MSLVVDLVHSVDQLTPQQLAQWNALADNPFQRWEWLGAWWNAYRHNQVLHLLLVSDGEQLVGIAPWFMGNRLATGRTLQFLGSGKACTDHLSLLTLPEDAPRVADAIAQWLVDSSNGLLALPRGLEWDAIELIGIDEDDVPSQFLMDGLRARGIEVQATNGLPCYVIDVPEDWESYVRMRSKSGRREIRQAQKRFDDGTIVVETAQTTTDVEQYWEWFVRLHQARRQDAGTSGCFDYPQFDVFLRSAAASLMDSGRLKLVIAKHRNQPVAAQFSLVDEKAWYFYQSGMDPNASDLRPGLSLFCFTIRETIESGRRQFDMLRGDESYKLRWRAQPRPTWELRAFSHRPTSQMRKRVVQVGQTFKNLIRPLVAAPQPHQ